MGKTWLVQFMDGTEEEIKAYRVTVNDTVLAFRVSHDASFRDEWVSFSVVNVKSWRQV